MLKSAIQSTQTRQEKIMKKSRIISAIFSSVAISAMALSTSASAGFHSGTISTLFASGPYNYALRVQLNAPETETCNYHFYYVNFSDGNYQVYVSLLTTAFAAGKTVALTSETDANGFCHIVEFSVVQ